MQDVLLGILMALLPNMADSGVEGNQGFSLYAMIGFRLLCGMEIFQFNFNPILLRPNGKRFTIRLNLAQLSSDLRSAELSHLCETALAHLRLFRLSSA